MITLAWYILKVIICSGILCGYYYLALRNKIFNRWNRFYLLASVVLALSAPIIKINIFRNTSEDKGTVIRMLQTINNSDEIIIEYSRHSGLQFTTENIIIASYLFITLLFFTVFFFAFYKIYRLRIKYPQVKMKEVNFIATDAKGTPFSFFKSIFWNNAIDLHSPQGQQIFNHEIAHVKEKHSYDKMFMNVVLLLFWMNPFFWLMRKELYMIHEFIADKEALEDNDLNAFAGMVLQTVYPGQNFSITNNFFHSPLKRRLIMFSKNKNPKVSYLSRLVVLPLAAFIFLAFTIKMKKTNPATDYVGKKITVVIDAGHGGSDNGAVDNNINEKDLNLAIAKDVQAMNKNPNLVIVLSRDKDVDMPLKDRTNFANDKKADLFISIHADVDANEKDISGLTIAIPKNDNPYLKGSQLLGSAILQSFENNYSLAVSNTLQQLQQGIWVLKENECPAVLIETGFLSNPKDASFLNNPKNQETIAQNILNGIEKYADNLDKLTTFTTAVLQERSDSIPVMYYHDKKVADIKAEPSSPNVKITYEDGSKETITMGQAKKSGLIAPPPPPPIPPVPPVPPPPPPLPPNALYIIDGKIVSHDIAATLAPGAIESINVLKGEKATKQYGASGKEGVIIITLKKDYDSNKTDLGENAATPRPIYFLNGKKITKEDMRSIPPNSIESMNVLTGETAIKKYGDQARNGVIEIITKSSGNYENDSITDKVFTKVENEASFPGGLSAWTKYMISKVQDSINTFTDKDYGTCLVKFIVNTDGTVSNVEATTMKDTHLANTAVKAIKTGPKWIPATQNGQIVAAYRLQPVTLTNPEADKKNN